MSKRSVKFLASAAVLAYGLSFLGSAPPAWAVGEGVSFSLAGCKGENLPADWVLEDEGFLCAGLSSDGTWFDAYTSGNLGKTWNELDLVPYRLTTDAGRSAPAQQTYDVNITADGEEVGFPGYDVITAPVLNQTLSEGLCSLDNVSPQLLLDPGVGGTDKSIARTLTITQGQNSVCVFDYVERLALGSNMFPGSSLHSNLLNEFLETGGIGNKDVSIPVKEIQPQELAKDMSATQTGGHAWNIVKSTNPATLDFGDTCRADGTLPDPQAVTITIEWDKFAISLHEIMVITNITATNPASRTILVNVTDVIYGDLGAGQVELSSGSIVEYPVAANSSAVILTHTAKLPAEAFDLNDVATASYVDGVTGVLIPGTTQATAEADVVLGAVGNKTAVITDSETITGTGLEFSVDSFAGASGSFLNAYDGTRTTGPVDWRSVTQSGDGYVELYKTVYLTKPVILDPDGSLDDIADLLGSEGFTDSDTEDVLIKATALFDLTITKTIPDVLQAPATFEFDVTHPDGTVQRHALAFLAGNTVKSLTIQDLAAGTYIVDEVPNAPWIPTVPQQVVTFGVPTCEATLVFENYFLPAGAEVNKACIGEDLNATFEMTLSGPGTPAGGEKVNVVCGQHAYFNDNLQEGSYSITEQVLDGWVQTGATGCDFDVDFPRDAGKTFVCDFENTQLGRILIDKVTVPNGDSQLFGFSLSGGPSELAQSFSLADATTPHDSGYVLPGSGYAAAEIAVDGWDLSSATCSDGSPVGNIDVSPGETVTCTFTNENRGTIVIEKISLEDSGTFDFTSTGGLTPNAFQVATTAPGVAGKGSRQFIGVTPGSYSVTESDPLPQFALVGLSCNDPSGDSSTSGATATIEVGPGETVTCTYTNQLQKGSLVIEKVTIGDVGDFGFATTGLSPTGFSLTTAVEGQAVSRTINDVFPNADNAIVYAVLETPQAGWVLSGASCNDQQSPSTVDNIQVGYGETVTCTFTNTKLGRILIDKVTVPGGDPQAFNFTLTGGPSGLNESFSLTDAAAPFDSGYVLAGSGYAAVEIVPGDWDLSSAACSDGSPVTDIDVGPGEVVTCTFTNQQGSLTVIKSVVNSCTGSALDGGRFNLLVDGALKAGDVKHGQGTGEVGVGLGVHTVAETAGTGTVMSDYISVIDANCDPVNIASGNDNPVCNITNIRKPKIIVRKSGGGGLPFNLLIDGVVVKAAAFDGEASNPIPVQIGVAHTVSETNPDGSAVSPQLYNTFITCSDGSSGQGTSLGGITLDSGHQVICTIYNNPLEFGASCVGPNEQ